MIPVLYQKDEINFTSNGIGRLIDMIDMSVEEELNAVYAIEFVYPVDGRLFDYMIKNGGVVYTTHDEKGDFQAFDIVGHTTELDGRVTFRGEHIRYRLKNYIVKPFEASSCAAAGAGIISNSLPRNNPFSFWTDKTTTGNFKLEVPQVAVSLLGGVEGSLLDVYGHGEYVFDMFDVKLYANRGIETGATIRYGKNMIDLNREYDESDIYSAIAPYWSKDGVTVYTPDLYVISGNCPIDKMVWTNQNGINITDNNGQNIEFQYAKIVPRPLDLTDNFEEEPTQQLLIDAAISYMERNKPWIPDENIEIDFVALWQSPEYESVAALQRFALGDKVSVYYPEVNLICENKQVIRVVYDPLNERYKSMELGNPKVSLSEAIVDSSEDDIRDIVEEYIPKSNALDKAIAHATQLISGGLGGHVVLKTNANGEPEELLIMDTDDINTAVNVWRWNQGGLGHSHNGYDGPYDDVALTMDGRINANMITTGLLNAALIKAGVLSDEAGRNYWNLETGEFSLQGYAKTADVISDVDVEYAQNQSATTAPTSGWSTTAPVWQDGYYIWTRTKTVSGGTTSYSDPACITGAKGATGATGPQGATGTGVSAIVEQYYLSTSNTTQTGGSWSTAQPVWASGKYIWTRSAVTWTNGTTTYTSPVLAKAINGANETAQDASDDVSALDTSLNQQGVFNRLTNNGQTQGIYLNNGLLYINASYIQGGTMTLGGVNNVNGTWRVLDANGTEVARGDKDGVTTKALTSTDYIYLNGGAGSYVNIPLSSANPLTQYLRISDDANAPFLVSLTHPVAGLVETIINSLGVHMNTQTGFASFSSELTYEGLTINRNGTNYLSAFYGPGYIELFDNYGEKRFETHKTVSPYSGDYEWVIYDASGNLWAKLGPSYFTDEPELQLVGHGNSDVILTPGDGLRIGNATLTETKLQQLLDLIGETTTLSIANGASGNINIPNSSNAEIVSSGAAAAGKFISICRTSSGGTVSHVELGNPGSNITFTTSTNTLKITNNSGYALYLVVRKF